MAFAIEDKEIIFLLLFEIKYLTAKHLFPLSAMKIIIIIETLLYFNSSFV